ncbi:MAG TPA: SRPBCC family protein [Myxococcota bacterium]|nr:SRPBCC family protein [Myxococcota bacterium]
MSDYGEFPETASVRFRRVLPGPIERVFAYLTEPELRASWFCRGELESRVGGRITLHFRHSDFAPADEPVPPRHGHDEDPRMTAEVTRWEPPRAFAFAWDGAEVIFELEPAGKDVRLTLTHRKLATRANLVDVSAGWHSHLDVLERALRGEKPVTFWKRLDELEREYAARVP